MRFIPNIPVATSAATVEVDAGLPSGRYRVQLVVFNSTGRTSQPAETIVSISTPVVPPIIIRPPIPPTPIR